LTLRAEAAPSVPARDERTVTGRNPFEGATVVNLSPAVAEELGLDPFMGPGVMVIGVGRGFAMNAGLRPGDVIREVNGRKVGAVRDLTELLSANGGTWRVIIERGGQQIQAQFRT
jgi:S1-C subfamily serine protease